MRRKTRLKFPKNDDHQRANELVENVKMALVSLFEVLLFNALFECFI